MARSSPLLQFAMPNMGYERTQHALSSPGTSGPLQLGTGTKKNDYKKDKRNIINLLGADTNTQFGYAQQGASALDSAIQYLGLPGTLDALSRAGIEINRNALSGVRSLGGQLTQQTGNPFLGQGLRLQAMNQATDATNRLYSEQLTPMAFADRDAKIAGYRQAQAGFYGPETLTSIPLLGSYLGMGMPNQSQSKPTALETMLGFVGPALGGTDLKKLFQ